MSSLKKDKEIKDQRFVLLSFLSPERVKTSDYNTLYEQLQTEKDLQIKCKLYEELLQCKQNIRGLKVRGVFDDFDRAKQYSVELRNEDTVFDIYVGTVGEWMPWDDTSRTEDNEYAEEELDKLMKEYHKQQKNSKKEHEERRNRNEF